MTERERLEKLYTELSNLLPLCHPEFKLENHCYLRIANDLACMGQWDKIVERPFIRNAKDKQLHKSVKFLSDMIVFDCRSTKQRVQFMNKLSLGFRGNSVPKNLAEYPVTPEEAFKSN